VLHLSRNSALFDILREYGIAFTILGTGNRVHVTQKTIRHLLSPNVTAFCSVFLIAVDSTIKHIKINEH